MGRPARGRGGGERGLRGRLLVLDRDRARARDARCDVLVLMLGDQPGVGVANVEALLDGRGEAPLAACAYSDGRGHPLAFARSMFGELAGLHGDKGVWKLLDHHADELVDVEMEGAIPLDVDTWDDYRRCCSPPPAERCARSDHVRHMTLTPR